MDENKQMLELLKQIEKANRQQVRTGRILCVLVLITVLCCGVTFGMVYQVLPQVTEILPQINTVLTQLESVLGNLEQTSGQLAALDLQSMVSDVDTLVVTGQEILEQSMEKLNTIDFEALNQAIQDLAAVVEPLAKVTNMFK